MESNNKDSPDSTTLRNNSSDRPKVPPLILLGTSTGAGTVSAKNSPIISRVSYNPVTDSYCHVPTTYNNNTATNNSATKVILIPSKSNLDKLSYMIKQQEVDGPTSSSLNNSNNNSSSASIPSSSSSSAAGAASSSSNKTLYGSHSRSSLPVRNFLRPSSMSLTSKLSKNQQKGERGGKVFTAGQSNNNQQASNSINNNSNSNDSASSSNHDISSLSTTSGSSSSTTPTNSRPITTTYFTTSTENPNQSIKLHIRRNPDHSETVHQQQVGVESPDSSVDSSSGSIRTPSSSSKNFIIDHDEGMYSPNNTHVNSSSDEASPKITQTPVIVVPNNRKLNNSVIRQLHPELLKQIEKQSHGNVVEISIDDGAPTSNRHNSNTSSRTHNSNTNNSNNIRNNNLPSDNEDEDSGEYVEAEEGDMQVSDSEVNSVSESRPNTITITIGEDGVISECGAVEASAEVDSRRTKRKRKPAKPFVPEMVVPRLKIRRKNENEVEGSPTVSFSLETFDEKEEEPKVDSTNAEVKVDPEEAESTPEPTRRQGRGRPRGSSNRNRTPAPLKPPGRGRGRPKGSTNKTKTEKEMLKAAATVKEEAIPKENGEKEVVAITPVSIPLVPIDLVESAKDVKVKQEGDDEAEVVSSTPAKRGRGGARGSRNKSATPRCRRAAQQRRSRKTPNRAKDADKTVKAPPVQVFEEETRMSADIKPPVPPCLAPSGATPADEESVGASNVSSTSTSATGTKTKKFTKDLVPDRKPVTAETLTEYAWPQPQPGETSPASEMYMLQEQVCEYLGVKSFKRKYPDLKRRIVDMEERDFLRSQKFVSESECDLGLTALCSSDVLDLMFNDFPEKYEEFNRVLQERKQKELAKLKGATTTSTPPVRDRTAEFYRRCLKSTAKWNALLNRQRMEERQCHFDLQTYTLHYQEGKMKVLPPEATKVGHYPVTVLPGQFCDYFKPYTATELKYLPLNTVLYGPVKQLQLPTSSAEAQSDVESISSSSDSSSSSDDDSSSSSDDSDEESEECTKSSTNKENRVDSPAVVRTCKTCDGDHMKNKNGQPEPLLHCTKCDVPNHPSCLDLREDMLPFIKKYNWQCTDCKNCIECNDPADEDKMLFCDLCDRGYHIYCVGLRKVPTGRWHCRVCSVCFSCGCTQASPDDRLAEWHHEFKKGEKNTRHFVHSLCVACHKLYKKGQYCPSCLKVHLKLDDTKNLAECWSCEKLVHKECVKRPLKSVFGFMCDPCDAAFRAKNKGLPPSQRLNSSFTNSNSNQ